MVGYKHPCRHCDKLVPPNAKTCPFCGRANPTGPLRCPKCRSPIEKGWVACSHCGLALETGCPKCGRKTFLDEYCSHCENRLVVVCANPKCKFEQPPMDGNCVQCGQPLN